MNAALTPVERAELLCHQPYAPQILADSVKKQAREGLHTQQVTVGGHVVVEQQLREGVERLEAIDGVHNGYDCSAFDPLLIWFASRFGWRITHQFAGTTIRYEPKTPTRHVCFHASTSHITYGGTQS